MAEIPRVLRGFDAFLDGRGYAGRCEEAQLPKLTLKTEDHRDGGMDGVIELDMGMEKLGDCVLTFTGYEAATISGFGRRDVAITLRGSIEDGDRERPVEAHIRGLCKEIDDGSWKGAEGGKRKVTVAPRYFRYRDDGRVLVEIDPVNMIRTVDGVDQLAQRRRNLGI